ncbi:hypothetical protein SporoP37_01940 [Sporosarcina sp. P37]|uniref:hypothetical protein n=1 Tax=unclassified Sporosarcina TaxID=2647733 RepID=UPI000A17A262|nr:MULTISPECIES: hypothetical protein [unclassified Sporosarcina]ARK23576.1 hypothetical protein SporoP37_01940 [Sporosarcina sp. P37]PID18802.1 hypothetical protein CSV62_06810 [Sporosarcina sp. P35]
MTAALTALKDKLKITWNEDDEQLQKLLNRSKLYLENMTGAVFDLAVEDDKLELLLERCRYVRNNAGDEFEINYAPELKRLILMTALAKNEVKPDEIHTQDVQ